MPPTAQGDFKAQPIAWNDLLPEFGVVHAAQEHPRVRPRVATLHEQDRRDLGQRFEHQHAGKERRAREVSLEKLFIDRHVLDGHEPAARLVRDHGVNETDGETVVDARKDRCEVERHPCLYFCTGTAGEIADGAAAAGFGVEPAASSAFTMSAVRFMLGSAQTSPLCAASKMKCTCFSAAT